MSRYKINGISVELMPSKKEACHEEIHFTLLYNEPNIGNSPEDREWELVDFEALIELDEKDADVKAVKKFTLPKEFSKEIHAKLVSSLDTEIEFLKWSLHNTNSDFNKDKIKQRIGTMEEGLKMARELHCLIRRVISGA